SRCWRRYSNMPRPLVSEQGVEPERDGDAQPERRLLEDDRLVGGAQPPRGAGRAGAGADRAGRAEQGACDRRVRPAGQLRVAPVEVLPARELLLAAGGGRVV